MFLISCYCITHPLSVLPFSYLKIEEKRCIEAMGYDFIMMKLSRRADLDDLDKVYRDACSLFDLPFRFHADYADRLVTQTPSSPLIPEIISRCIPRASRLQRTRLLALSLLCDPPSPSLLSQLIPTATHSFAEYILDYCDSLKVTGDRIACVLSMLPTLHLSVSTKVLNTAIARLAGTGDLTHAIHCFTEVAAIRRERVTREAFVGLVVGLVCAGGEDGVLESCLRGMREEGYEMVKVGEWATRSRDPECGWRIKEYVGESIWKEICEFF